LVGSTGYDFESQNFKSQNSQLATYLGGGLFLGPLMGFRVRFLANMSVKVVEFFFNYGELFPVSLYSAA
jgi:hypothetical protein